MERVETGVSMLDAALGGGFAFGTSVVLTGQEGAGATEFALGFLRHAMGRGKRRGRLASALRSPGRVGAEMTDLFDDPGAPKGIDIRAVDAEKLRANPLHLMEGLQAGDILLLESAAAIAEPHGDASFIPFWRVMADAAAERSIVVILLHAASSLQRTVEVAMEETSDAVMEFAWQQSGPSRRRTLTIVKLRGLSPALESHEVPVYEISLQKGSGISISRGRSVL